MQTKIKELENEVQYVNTKKKLSELQEGLKTIQKKYSSDKNKLSLLSKGYKEHITQLKLEIKYYEAKKNRKAQLKIQETAFMLLALAFLFALLFIFYSNYQIGQIYSEKNKLLQEQALSLLEKFMAMPEFSCLHGSCIDEDKLIVLRNMTLYNDLWKGITKIQIVKIYPKREIITVYQKGNAEISYSSFVPLCKTRQLEGYIWQECSLAKLLVSIEKAKLERK